MQVSDLMQKGVRKVKPTDSLLAAASLLHEHDCGCVVVADEQHRPIGIVTDRDVCMAAARTQRPLVTIQVIDAMTEPPFTCRAEDPIAAAEDQMALHQVRRLPVVDAAGRLIGLLSLDDIALEAGREQGLLAPPVSCAAVGRTLAQIVRPRLVADAARQVHP